MGGKAIGLGEIAQATDWQLHSIRRVPERPGCEEDGTQNRVHQDRRWPAALTAHLRPAYECEEEAASPAPSSDFDHVRRLCMQFISTMSANRSNCNDAGVAQDVMRDLEERGQLKARTRRRLTHGCHTDGSVYQAGVPLARAICEALYGRVLPRED